MAYQGYRLKINNVVFPNHYVSRGTYKSSRNPRKAGTYNDILGVSHDVFYPTEKTLIEFSVKPHSTDEHTTLASYFTSRSNVTVEYFDNNTETYKTGTFRVVDFTWQEDNATSTSIDYAETPIKLEEY